MTEISTWSDPPDSVLLAPGEVHVWQVELDQPEHLLGKFRNTLDPDELERASRFHFEKHRRHFIVGRGVLRQVLSHYLEAKPETFRFAYGAFGKPALSSAYESSRLRFNMSHSHGVALFAVAADKELGIDVEHVRANFASAEIARRFFARSEVETFEELPLEEQVAAFFRCWTRKEAYIKAIGRGMSQPLDEFDVTLAPDEPAALLYAKEDDAERWVLEDLDLGKDYAGALVVEAPVAIVRCWRIIHTD